MNKRERLKEVKTSKVKTRLGCGLYQRDIFYFYLFIYLVIQRLIEESGKLSINLLTKINIFSTIHWNKKERLDDDLTRLDCGQNQIDLFYNLF